MGHYYKQDGSACYFQPDGKDTTIRHARPQKLVPSVTEVLNVAASPGLAIYKQNQLLDSVIRYNPSKFWSLDEVSDEQQKWRKTVVAMSKQHAEKAAAEGKKVHDMLERWFKGEHVYEARKLVLYVMECFEENGLPLKGWVAEKSFASPLGFGGCVDLHHPEARIILDFKTKSNDNFSKARAYESHHMQTAAYAVGLFANGALEIGDLGSVKRYNLFINKDNFNEMKLTESTDFDKDWKMYYNLLEYWKLVKNYDGSF
jgi:hypothetical protein